MNEQKLASTITDAINPGIDNREFCEAMSREHRSLQYDFTNMCLAWLDECRKMYEEGRYDARNEYACKTGKILMDYFHKGEWRE